METLEQQTGDCKVKYEHRRRSAERKNLTKLRCKS